MTVNKNSKEFWLPLKIKHKNYHMSSKAEKWFKISNLGNFKVTAKKREVLMENNEAKIGANTIKVSKNGLDLHLFYNKNKGIRGYCEEKVNIFIKSLTGLNPKSYTISYLDNNPSNITYTNVMINNRSIKNIILYRYKNIQTLTEYEKTFFDLFRLVSSEKKTKWNRFFKKYNTFSRRKERKPINFIQSQKIFLRPSSFYIADYYFPFANIIIEIDGLHHYSNKKQIDHDLERDIFLKERFKVDIIRISNLCLFTGKNRANLIRKIQDIVLLKLEIFLITKNIKFKGKDEKEFLYRQSASKLLSLQEELFANRFR